MKSRLLAMLLFVFMSCSAIAADAVSTMASVLIGLNHFASQTDKEKLGAIVEDASSTNDEKLLAQIISRVAHQPGSEDKAALEDIIARSDVSDAIKTISKALLGMNHRPTDSHIEALKSLI